MKFVQMGIIASTIVLFTACSSVEDLVENYVGGDDDDNSVNIAFTGQFVDTYVKGLNYTCIGYIDGVPDLVTDSGVTNEKGEFTCSNRGELVEFSVGNYVIGSYQNSGFDDDTAPVVSPYSFGLSAEASLNMAQLLQTLNDGTTEGALTIPSSFTALDNVDIKLDDLDFDALMADALNVNSLVSEEVAQAHLDETLASLAPVSQDVPVAQDVLLRERLAGNTFYTAGQADGALESWAFNAEVTSLTWTEEVGGTESGTETVSLDGMTLSSPMGPMVVTEITETYLAISVDAYNERLYTTLDGAAAYYGVILP